MSAVRGKTIAEALESGKQKAVKLLEEMLERPATVDEAANAAAGVSAKQMTPEAAAAEAFQRSGENAARTSADANWKGVAPERTPESIVGQKMADEAIEAGQAARVAEGDALASRFDSTAAAQPEKLGPFEQLGPKFDPAAAPAPVARSGALAATGLGTLAVGAAGLSGDNPRPLAGSGPIRPEPVAGAAEVPPEPSSAGATPDPAPAASTTPAATPDPAPPRVGAHHRSFEGEAEKAGLNTPPTKLVKPAELDKNVATQKAELAKLRQDPDLNEDTRLAAGRLERELSALKTEYQENKDRVAWSQMAELFGNALAKIGAARYGLANGVDMSGTKFHYNDWEKTYDRLSSERRQAFDESRERYSADSATIAAQRRSLEAARSRFDSARTESTRAGLDVEKENLQNENQQRRDRANLASTIAGHNASAGQSADTTNAHLDAQRARDKKADEEKAAEAKTRAKSAEEKAAYDRDEFRWKEETKKFEGAQQKYDEGLQELRQSYSMEGKAREQARRGALSKIGGFVDPTLLKKYGIEHKADQGWFDRDDALDKLLDDIDSGRGVTPTPPRWDDYAGAGPGTPRFGGGRPVTNVERAIARVPVGAATPAAKTKPKTVIQGGVTYTLNEATGKYE